MKQKFITEISTKPKRTRTRAYKLLNYIYKRYNQSFDQIDNLIKPTEIYSHNFKKNGRFIHSSHFGKVKFEIVPLNQVVSNQPYVSKNVVGKKIQGKWIEPHDPANIELVYWNGEYHVDDGNHRVNRDKLLGRKFIKAKVIYADEFIEE